MIGIFWIYQDKIYSYKEVVVNDDNQDIETGHVDYWQILQSKHKELRSYSYDYILRGRVLLKDEEIIVYSSNDIVNDKKSTNLIVNDFKLDDPKFVYDEHYRKILDLDFDNDFNHTS